MSINDKLNYLITLQALAYTFGSWGIFKYLERKDFDLSEFDSEIKEKVGDDPTFFFTLMHFIIKILKNLDLYSKVALLSAVLLEVAKITLRNTFPKEIPYSSLDTSTSLLTGVLLIHFLVFYLLTNINAHWDEQESGG